MEEKELHIPKGACIPRNQVAGHKHEGRSKLGMSLCCLLLSVSCLETARQNLICIVRA